MKIPRSVSTMRLEFDHAPRTVLVVSKPNDPDVEAARREIVRYLELYLGVRVLHSYPVLSKPSQADSSSGCSNGDADADADIGVSSLHIHSPLVESPILPASSTATTASFGASASSSANRVPNGSGASFVIGNSSASSSTSSSSSLSLSSLDSPSKSLEEPDFVVSLGGDGTVLHISSLFPRSAPPILSFHLGSLGFLTPFFISEHEDILRRLVDDDNLDHPILLRMRIQVIFSDDYPFEPRRTTLDDLILKRNAETGAEMYHSLTALNEVVIDRGVSPYLTGIECYVDGEFVTHISADGVIVASATGSTAYSLSAGGSMVHPSVPAILLTPICPHSLSFRPLVLPDQAVICLRVPEDSRCSAWASVDGRNRREIKRGECVWIARSPHPLGTFVRTEDGKRGKSRSSWFRDLAECLNWNARERQKAWVVPKPGEQT
eukprot:ANDGO_03368.mRNA.1 putative NAD kinase 2